MEDTNNRSKYGRMASQEEIKESLYRIARDDVNPAYGGIPLFSDETSVYVEKDDAHSIIFGITGSKKSRLIGMPALRIYAMAGESFIANDPKGELYERTYSLLNEQGYKIVVINLREPARSNSWNPLQMPYLQYSDGQKDKAIEFVRDMADCITHNGHSMEPYWQDSASNLLAGLIMLLFEYAEKKEIHLKSLRALRSQAFKIVAGEIPYIRSNFLKHVDKSSFIYSLLSGTVDVTESTRSCIISVFDQAMLTFFSQDGLIDMLSGSDFDISAIGRTKTAVFLITPDENTVYNKLISVFVKQCYTELICEAEKYPDRRLPLRVNFLLDEFANLPEITDFTNMITASRSRNIRFNLFIQSKIQLADRYGIKANTIQSNCENWVLLYSREYSLLEDIISLSGMKNPDEPLVTATVLLTLDKNKGEAYILNKRLYPYITSLWDIDMYPILVQEEKTVLYPENVCKANDVFDLEAYSHKMFNLNNKPIFSTKMSENTALKKNNNEKATSDSFKTVTLKGYGSSVGRGWYGLISPVLKEINLFNKENKGKEIQISQIKEKYGSLRIHVTNCPDYIKGMISIIENESQYICEMCGARGETVIINRWYWTLCPHHAKAKKAAGYDKNVESRLYRKYMDTYERSEWSSLYNPVIKRSIKKNWFITKQKVEGIIRTIKLERENKRTNFYVKAGKNYIKHEIYVQWSENTNKIIHDGYWHVMLGNEIESYWILERESAEIEAAKKIYFAWGKEANMELIRMVSLEEGRSYPPYRIQINYYEFWDFIKKYLVEHQIKMTGAEHHKYGIPLITSNGTVYAFILSFNDWGRLMAEAFEPENKSKLAYLKWASKRPEGEVSWLNPDN